MMTMIAVDKGMQEVSVIFAKLEACEKEKEMSFSGATR